MLDAHWSVVLSITSCASAIFDSANSTLSKRHYDVTSADVVFVDLPVSCLLKIVTICGDYRIQVRGHDE